MEGVTFLLCWFVNRLPVPPAAISFVARRKISKKGVPKGSEAALWILAFYTGVWRGDVRRSYEFAQVQFTRFRLVRWRAGGVRFARLCRKAKHHLFAAISLSQALLPPDSCLLRPDGGASASPEEVPLGCGAQKDQSTSATTQLPDSQTIGYSIRANDYAAVGAVQRGKGISGAPPPT